MLILSLFLIKVTAQVEFRPGYVVKLDGDTLAGKIEYLGRDVLMGKRCRFIQDDQSYIKTFYPEDIVSYRFTDGKYFVSTNINGKKVFMEFLVKGKINLYYLKDETGDRYFLENDTSGLMQIPYREDMQSIDGKQYLHQSSRHRALYSYFMQDAPQLENRINEMQEPEQNSLIRLVSNYHNIVCKDYACTVYEKKKEPVRVNVELTGGIADFNEKYFEQKFALQTGILADWCLQDLSESLFLRTGLLYSPVREKESHSILYKFPLLLEHVSGKGTFRPREACGVNFYPGFKDMSFALMGGMAVRMLSSFDLVIEYNVDFCHKKQNSLMGLDFFSQSLQTGFCLNF